MRRRKKEKRLKRLEKRAAKVGDASVGCVPCPDHGLSAGEVPARVQ